MPNHAILKDKGVIILYSDAIHEATRFIQKRFPKPIDTAIVLGSGLGPLADLIEDPVILDYHEIPHFPTSTIEGHEGKMYLGTLGDKTILAMKGRVHYYEGYDMKEVTFPIRVLALLKVKQLILTNACGGIDDSLSPGDIAYLTDHLSFFCPSPLRGLNLDEFGPRFKDMSEIYTPALIEKALAASQATGIPIKPSIYGFFPGPRFETPAEIRALKTLGATSVGMSTVPEAIVARHSSLPVLGISLITNKAAGLSASKLSHQEVQEAASQASQKLVTLIHQILITL